MINASLNNKLHTPKYGISRVVERGMPATSGRSQKVRESSYVEDLEANYNLKAFCILKTNLSLSE